VCGREGSCIEDNTIARDSDLHEVRCCSDVEIPGWQQNNGCGIWGTSEINGVCHWKKTFERAVAICSDSGARLCTRSELEEKCPANTGCEFNYELIWSSTSGYPTNAPTKYPTNVLSITTEFFPSSSPSAVDPAGSHWVVCGSEGLCIEDKKIVRDNDLHEVRCCSDVAIAGWRKNNACGIWGQSKFSGVCHSKKMFESAVAICSASGARLCTKSEIEEKCSANTGCEFNFELIWSSTSGYPSNAPTKYPTNKFLTSSSPSAVDNVGTHWVMCGSEGLCIEDNTMARDSDLHEVRCCSDIAIAGWRKNDACGIWGKSKFNGVCHAKKKFESAVAICYDNGGRLCTKSELEEKCSANTGCKFNEELMWSSTSGYPTNAPTKYAGNEFVPS